VLRQRVAHATPVLVAEWHVLKKANSKTLMPLGFSERAHQSAKLTGVSWQIVQDHMQIPEVGVSSKEQWLQTEAGVSSEELSESTKITLVGPKHGRTRIVL